MVLSSIKNIATKQINATKQTTNDNIKNNPEEKINTEKKQYKGALYGAMFGIGAGIGDSIATIIDAKHNIKKASEAFKNSSFSEKKEVIKSIHEKNLSIRGYKEFLTKNTSFKKNILRRSLLYGGIISAIGFASDFYKNNKAKTK